MYLSNIARYCIALCGAHIYNIIYVHDAGYVYYGGDPRSAAAAISVGGKFCFAEKGISRDFKPVAAFAPRPFPFAPAVIRGRNAARMMIKYASEKK